MKKLGIGLVSILSLTSFLPGLASELRAQAKPFYKGKTIASGRLDGRRVL